MGEAYKRCLTVSPQHPRDEREDEQNEENEEKDLGDIDGAGGNTPEPEHSCDQGNHEKYGRPFQHCALLSTQSAIAGCDVRGYDIDIGFPTGRDRSRLPKASNIHSKTSNV